MRTITLICVLSFTVSAIACQGNVKTTALPSDALTVGKSVPGVVFFFPQLVKVIYSFTALADATGKIIATSDLHGCRQVFQKEDVSILPDFSRPMLLENNSPLSFAKFAVTLNNGMLASVNSEPTQSAADLLSSGATLLKASSVGLATAMPGPPLTPCNAEPRITKLSKAIIED
jgi:hypothetical protein